MLVVDSFGKHWVKFSVKRVVPSPEKPHGLSYSLTLHDESGKRLVGFDNAHSVGVGKGFGRKKKKRYDHKHRLRTVLPYEYQDAISLLTDFWTSVDEVLKEKGVI